MRWLLLWAVASVPASLAIGRLLGGPPQPGLTRGPERRENGHMTTSAHPALATYYCVECGRREREGLNDGTYRCEDCQSIDHRGHGCPDDPTWDPDTQTFSAPPPAGTAGALAVESGRVSVREPRTAALVALEFALAKAHYYNADTLEEQIARHDRLVALEEEHEALERQEQIDA